MKLDPHEEKMRNILSGQRIDVDADQLWRSLEKFVPEQKPRRPKAIYLIWPLMFLCISLGTMAPHKKVAANSHDITGANETVKGNKVFNSDFAEAGIAEVLKSVNATHSGQENDNQIQNIITHKAKANYTESNKLGEAGIKANKTILKSAKSGDKYQNTDTINISHSTSGMTSSIQEQRILTEPFNKLQTLEINALAYKHSRVKKYKRIFPEKPKQVTLSLGLAGGIVVQEHRLAQSLETDFLEKQKQTDTGRELTGIQIGIAYPLSKKFYVKSGLNYTRAATRLTLSETRYSRVQIEGVNGLWEDEQGNLHEVSGPVYASRQTNYNVNWTSYHHMLDIPLSLGYRLKHYKRNIVSVEAGVVYHMLHKFDGAVLDSAFNLNHDDEVARNFTQNKLSVRLGLEWECRLSTTYSLFAGIQATDILLKNSGIDLTSEKRLYLINGIVGVKLYPGNM